MSAAGRPGHGGVSSGPATSGLPSARGRERREPCGGCGGPGRGGAGRGPEAAIPEGTGEEGTGDMSGKLPPWGAPFGGAAGPHRARLGVCGARFVSRSREPTVALERGRTRPGTAECPRPCPVSLCRAGAALGVRMEERREKPSPGPLGRVWVAQAELCRAGGFGWRSSLGAGTAGCWLSLLSLPLGDARQAPSG